MNQQHSMTRRTKLNITKKQSIKKGGRHALLQVINDLKARKRVLYSFKILIK
jgi:hypothetical protein